MGDLPSRLLCASLLWQGHPYDGAWFILKAAWANDDQNCRDAAQALREKAAEAFISAGPSRRNQDEDTYLVVVDLLRRSRRWPDALGLLERQAIKVASPVERAARVLQRQLIDAKDDGLHTLEEALAPPPGVVPPESSDDERIGYLLHHAQGHLTGDERVALRSRPMWDGSRFVLDARAESLLKDGMAAFLDALEARLATKVTFNRCPKCSRLARTPLARQCRHCGHDKARPHNLPVRSWPPHRSSISSRSTDSSGVSSERSTNRPSDSRHR